jgi:hypothetical protein
MTWSFTTPELIGFGTNIALIVALWARIEVRDNQREKDIKLLKQALGYENGDRKPAFVRTETCDLIHADRGRRVDEIDVRLRDLTQQVRQSLPPGARP